MDRNWAATCYTVREHQACHGLERGIKHLEHVAEDNHYARWPSGTTTTEV